MGIQLSTSERKLVAVLGVNNACIFYRTIDNGYIAVSANGTCNERGTQSLEFLLTDEPERKPVYEGDVLTITF